MNLKQIKKIFNDTAYERMGGSEQELKCAEYIASILKEQNLDAKIEPFTVPMATINSVSLTVDGKKITCKGYYCCGSHELTAPIYYLRADDKYSLENCRGKIVMIDGIVRYWLYKDLLENGALGIITYDGDVHYADSNIYQRELRSYFSNGEKIPCVNINVRDAIKLIENEAKEATISISQDEYEGNSHNVTLLIPGEREEEIVFTAHYDSTSLSHGAYDNMSGSVGLIAMAEHFAKAPHSYSLRFVWCGSEERGLLGAKAYCASHAEELNKIALNINLDMIGCTMGRFIACCTTENALVSYVGYMADELGFQVKAYQDVYSSDSTPFADNGIPAISFARLAGKESATIHNSYDTAKIINAKQMQLDIAFITAFAERMANSKRCPVSKNIPDNIKEKLDEYLLRKRKK